MDDTSSDSGISLTTSEDDPGNYDRLPAHDGPGYIYIIREENTDYYKVGSTNNPTTRIRDLRTGNPRHLIFKRIIRVEDRWQAETWLHGRLADMSVQDGGGREWFEFPYNRKQELYQIVEEELPQFLNSEEDTSESEGSWSS